MTQKEGVTRRQGHVQTEISAKQVGRELRVTTLARLAAMVVHVQEFVEIVITGQRAAA